MQKESLNSVKIRYQPSRNEIIGWTKQLLDILRKDYNLHYLAIFGSYASEQYGVGSDIDLVIVHDSNLTFEKTLSFAIGISKIIDWEIHLYSINNFKTGLDQKNMFFQSMLRNNIAFHQSNIFKTLLAKYEFIKDFCGIVANEDPEKDLKDIWVR